MSIPSVLLDTHVLIWLLRGPDELRDQQRRLISKVWDGEGLFGVSAISLWEIALLLTRNRLRFQASVKSFLDEIENHSRIAVLPINSAVATETATMGTSLHNDPADRIIVATARIYRLPLLTVDEKIRASGLVEVI